MFPFSTHTNFLPKLSSLDVDLIAYTIKKFVSDDDIQP